MSMGLLFSIGIGGFIGAILRFTLSGGIQKIIGSTFPFGTLFVNVLGSFIIGFLFLYFQQVNLSVYQKSLLITGLLGALTTFSTFSLDTVLLMGQGFYMKALINVMMNVVFSVGATFLGMILFKRLYL
jgi:CrcB protein